ncbi:ribonuclease H-like domain-containing protein [Tanacetum coccineum]|uniref:Ribonuclease H-like domain-containing protein n=1 Tax=Tanacetum coccineum TaxID=301880 RepID=A0ABQ5H681_9ASTR
MFITVTAEEKTNKKNDVKARSLLLMALPNEHQLIFSQYPDAKSMFPTIETRFGESLDSIFNRLQKIVSRLAILGVVIAQEDLNSKNLSNLPSGTLMYTAGFNDNVVYNFMVENPNGSNLLHQDLEQIHKDDLEAMDLKWQLSLLSMRAKRYYQRIGKKIFINANDTAGYDKSKVECFNYHKLGHFARECRAPRSKEANSIELGRPPGIKRLSNPLKILVAPDSSNPADSESTNSGIFCSEGQSSNSSTLGHVDPE